MRDINILSVDSNILKDHTGKIVVTISSDLGRDVTHAYAHVFAAASELLEYMRELLIPIIDRYLREGDFSKDKYARLGGYRPYTQISVRGSFVEWIKLGLHAVGFTEGDETRRDHFKMKSKTELRQLFIEGNILKDDKNQHIATISKDLPIKVANDYARKFVASVEILDIIDFKSQADLEKIKNEYQAGLEFNKHEKLPPDVSILGISQPFIPDDLEKARRLVAKAKGREYKDWS